MVYVNNISVRLENKIKIVNIIIINHKYNVWLFLLTAKTKILTPVGQNPTSVTNSCYINTFVCVCGGGITGKVCFYYKLFSFIIKIIFIY